MAVAAQNVAQAALEKATLAQRTLANELKALNSLQLSDTKTTKQAVTATPVTPVASESKVTSLGATSSTNQTNANDAVVGTKESEQREAATPVVTNLAVKTGAAKVDLTSTGTVDQDDAASTKQTTSPLSTVKATVKASGAKQTKQATSASDKDDVVKLPQTGNAEEETAVLAEVGSLMMGLAMALGFKKKRI